MKDGMMDVGFFDVHDLKGTFFSEAKRFFRELFWTVHTHTHIYIYICISIYIYRFCTFSYGIACRFSNFPGGA